MGQNQSALHRTVGGNQSEMYKKNFIYFYIRQIVSYTWAKENSQLYDFEGKNITRVVFNIDQPGFIIKDGLQSKFQQQPFTNSIAIAKISLREGKWFLKSTAVDMWQVIKQNRNSDKQLKHGYQIKVGCEIRMGRVKFQIVELNSASGQTKLQQIESHFSIQGSKVYDTQIKINILKQSHPPCRICLSISIDPPSPLVSPCNCTGSVAFIHISCLQQWFGSKVQIKDENNSVIYYGWRTLECELCKKTYSCRLKVGDREYDLIELKRPMNIPYILLQQKERNLPKGMYLLAFSGGKTQMKIGRGSDVELRLADISVSRVHSILQLQQNNFYVYDIGSKFGTLVNVPVIVTINQENEGQQYQFNQTLLEIHIKNQQETNKCCFWKKLQKKESVKKNNELISEQIDNISQHSPPLDPPIQPNRVRLSNPNLRIQSLEDIPIITQPIQTQPIQVISVEEKDESSSNNELELQDNLKVQIIEEVDENHHYVKQNRPTLYQPNMEVINEQEEMDVSYKQEEQVIFEEFKYFAYEDYNYNDPVEDQLQSYIEKINNANLDSSFLVDN